MEGDREARRQGDRETQRQDEYVGWLFSSSLGPPVLVWIIL
jgi:hypothetical protein